MPNRMHAGSQNLKDSSANIIPLEMFLEGTPAAFRLAVRNALLEEGFDLDETLPNLQLVSHILESVSALRHHEPHDVWDPFVAALRSADRKGVLVDLSLQRRWASSQPQTLLQSRD